MRVRRATRDDLDALVRLEAAFPGDRLSRASFLRFIEGTTVDVWVAIARDGAAHAAGEDPGSDTVVG
ncbi:MAG: hypothetical protein ABR510_14440, partial [Trueperaceae bacterium]